MKKSYHHHHRITSSRHAYSEGNPHLISTRTVNPSLLPSLLIINDERNPHSPSRSRPLTLPTILRASHRFYLPSRIPFPSPSLPITLLSHATVSLRFNPFGFFLHPIIRPLLHFLIFSSLHSSIIIFPSRLLSFLLSLTHHTLSSLPHSSSSSLSLSSFARAFAPAPAYLHLTLAHFLSHSCFLSFPHIRL